MYVIVVLLPPPPNAREKSPLKDMAKTSIRRKAWLKKRVRTKLSLGILGKYPRLVIFKSNKHIYGQLIDDNTQKTLLSSSTSDKELAKDLASISTKVEESKIVGYSLAKKIKSKKIDKIIYDRNGYRYHGRVKALAESARDGGLVF